MSMWVISYIALWLVVAALVFSDVVLFRQLGLLHLRFGPRGALALDEGPAIGASAPRFSAVDQFGTTHAIGGAGLSRLIVFVTPKCAVCDDLIPALRAVHASAQNVLVVSAADAASTRPFAEKLGRVPIVASSEAAETYNVASTPFSIYIDAGGTVRSKGLVNNLEQLEEVMPPPDTRIVQMERELEETRV